MSICRREAMSSKLLWAKADTNNTDSYHPLLYHSIDTAAVALELIQNRMSNGKLQVMYNFFSPGDMELVQKTVCLFCALHDIGKAVPSFQAKVQPLKSALQQSGFPFDCLALQTGNFRHNYFSQKLLINELQSELRKLVSGPALAVMSKAVGGHHGEFPRADRLNRISAKILGDHQIWQNSRLEIFNTLTNILQINNVPQNLELNTSTKPLVLQYWLAGLITLSDWIASMSGYFHHAAKLSGDLLLQPEQYYEEAKQRAAYVLSEIGFNKHLPAGSLPEFDKLFGGYNPRQQQSEITGEIEKFQAADAPYLIIIEAPMGIGKTEAAFVASELINLNTSQQGVYIAMPTQATSNQMYDRYKKFLNKRLPADSQGALNLLHSASDLYIMNTAANENPEAVGDDYNLDNYAALEAQTWFKPKKRGLLTPFAVGTIDQVLISVISAKHNFLRLYGLSAKTVIFDEVHSYDLYMSTILMRFLSWAASMGISVILLSATLPKNKREALVSSFSRSPLIDESPYPRLTIVSGTDVRSLPLTPPVTKTIALEKILSPDNNSIINHICNKTTDGGCVAVICNTVSRAQELYEEFKSTSASRKISSGLLHARFTADRRNIIEAETMNYFGRHSRRPEKMVLFSTQIIEQSLDLDFDHIISELCPIDLLLQRAGRLHRHPETKRPECLREPSMTLLIPEDDFFSQTGRKTIPYSFYVLYKTLLNLKSVESISIHNDIEMLIEQVYGDNYEPGTTDKEKELLSLLRVEYEDEQTKFSRAAKSKIIADPDGETGEEVMYFDDDDPSVHPAVAAATRIGLPSMKVVCVLAEADCEVLANKTREPYELGAILNDKYIEAVLGASVPISGEYRISCILKDHNTQPPSSWRKHSMLRYLRVLRFVDGVYNSGALIIKYSEKLGISYGNK